MFGIDWLGMLNAAMGMRALGLLNPVDISSMSEKEVDTVVAFLKEKKKEGHFQRHVEGLRRAGEPDGLRGGVDRRCLVAGGRRGLEQGHPGALRRRQGGLPCLVQRLRAFRRTKNSTAATSG
jgi:hypothetical protein